MKKGNDNSYRSILKGTSIFGGVQIFQILAGLVRGKFVAILLGPEGMGISNLFTATSTTITKIAGLGLPLALTKEVSVTKEDSESLGHTLAIARRLIIVTGVIAALACFIFAPYLSRMTFGDTAHSMGFRLLSMGVLFATAAAGEAALLQGMHDVKRLSKATIIGSVGGLLIGVPLYWAFGFNGIVPAIVLMSMVLWIFYYRSARKAIDAPEINFSWRQHMPTVKKLLMLGLVLVASDAIGQLFIYLLNVFLRAEGGVDTVGFYSAANSITNQYSGMVFAAMALDYFPRLTAIASDNDGMREVVNRQSEIVSYIVTPLAMLLVITSPIVIRILLTSEYLVITDLMRWMALGIMLKALSFPMGYITFAKDNKRLFFILEGLVGNISYFLCACIFFHFFGLIGMGYAMVVDNLFCLILYYAVNSHYYGYRFSKAVVGSYTAAILIGFSTFAASYITNTVLSHTLMGALLAASMTWSIVKLKSRLAK